MLGAKIRPDIWYPVTPDIRYPSFRFAGYPAKSAPVFGVYLVPVSGQTDIFPVAKDSFWELRYTGMVPVSYRYQQYEQKNRWNVFTSN
jgi:hypothetical protein